MSNIKVVGKGGISATIIAHSKSVVDGSEIITLMQEICKAKQLMKMEI